MDFCIKSYFRTCYMQLNLEEFIIMNNKTFAKSLKYKVFISKNISIREISYYLKWLLFV